MLFLKHAALLEKEKIIVWKQIACNENNSKCTGCSKLNEY